MISNGYPQSISNGYLARYWQILPESCKITIHSATNLQDNHFSARILQGKQFSTRILQDNHFSARILQDSNFSARIFMYLSESPNISSFLHKILQDELINASNSDSKR